MKLDLWLPTTEPVKVVGEVIKEASPSELASRWVRSQSNFSIQSLSQFFFSSIVGEGFCPEDACEGFRAGEERDPEFPPTQPRVHPR